MMAIAAKHNEVVPTDQTRVPIPRHGTFPRNTPGGAQTGGGTHLILNDCCQSLAWGDRISTSKQILGSFPHAVVIRIERGIRILDYIRVLHRYRCRRLQLKRLIHAARLVMVVVTPATLGTASRVSLNAGRPLEFHLGAGAARRLEAHGADLDRGGDEGRAFVHGGAQVEGGSAPHFGGRCALQRRLKTGTSGKALDCRRAPDFFDGAARWLRIETLERISCPPEARARHGRVIRGGVVKGGEHVPFFDRGILQVFEKRQPAFVVEIEGSHVVEFLGHLMDASKNDHKVFEHACRVAASGDGRVHSILDRGPFVILQVENPDIVELLIVLISPTEDDHVVPVDHSRMAGTWLWQNAIRTLDEVPPALFEVILQHLIGALPISGKATEYYHLAVFVYKGSMVIT